MNIERIQERALGMVVLIGGLLFSVYCGMQAGGGNFRNLGLIFAVLTIMGICMAMRERLWILIPLCWGLTGKMVALPIPVALRDLVVLVVFVAFFAFRALKVVRTRISFGLLEGLVVVNVIYVATMFMRNPVGAKAFGSEMVGGRPYWDIAIATLAFWVLSSAPADRKNLKRIPLFVLFGVGAQAATEFVGFVAPSIAMHLGEFYSGFFPMLEETSNTFTAVDQAYVRWMFLGEIGVLSVIGLCAYFRPITLFFAPLRVLALLAALFGILLSGFRTAVLKAGAAFFFGTLFRKRTRDLFILGGIGFALLIVVIVGNGRLFNLPLTAQRALSFLPGQWDADAVKDAEDSKQWRVDMWRMVVTEDKWIQNKWLGDGFGFTKRELGIMETMRLGGPGFLGGAQQELFMIVGSFHNGPLSTIRYGGVVGLVLFLLLIGLSAKEGVRLLRLSANTPMFPVTFFLMMPILYTPIEFVAIVGGYDSNMPVAIVAVGFLGMIRRNFAEQPLMETSDDNTILADSNLESEHRYPAFADDFGVSARRRRGAH